MKIWHTTRRPPNRRHPNETVVYGMLQIRPWTAAWSSRRRRGGPPLFQLHPLVHDTSRKGAQSRTKEESRSRQKRLLNQTTPILRHDPNFDLVQGVMGAPSGRRNDVQRSRQCCPAQTHPRASSNRPAARRRSSEFDRATWDQSRRSRCRTYSDTPRHQKQDRSTRKGRGEGLTGH